MIELAFSILASDFAHLADEVAGGGAGWWDDRPCGCDGWAFCAEYYVRASDGEGSASGDEAAAGLSFDDRESG